MLLQGGLFLLVLWDHDDKFFDNYFYCEKVKNQVFIIGHDLLFICSKLSNLKKVLLIGWFLI